MCAHCVYPTVAVERYRRESCAVAVEPFWKIAPRTNSNQLLFVLFFFFDFLFSSELNLLFFSKA